MQYILARDRLLPLSRPSSSPSRTKEKDQVWSCPPLSLSSRAITKPDHHHLRLPPPPPPSLPLPPPPQHFQPSLRLDRPFLRFRPRAPESRHRPAESPSTPSLHFTFAPIPLLLCCTFSALQRLWHPLYWVPVNGFATLVFLCTVITTCIDYISALNQLDPLTPRLENMR